MNSVQDSLILTQTQVKMNFSFIQTHAQLNPKQMDGMPNKKKEKQK